MSKENQPPPSVAELATEMLSTRLLPFHVVVPLILHLTGRIRSTVNASIALLPRLFGIERCSSHWAGENLSQ